LLRRTDPAVTLECQRGSTVLFIRWVGLESQWTRNWNSIPSPWQGLTALNRLRFAGSCVIARPRWPVVQIHLHRRPHAQPACARPAPKGVMQEESFPLDFGMASVSLDTSVTAHDLQERAHFRLGPEGRLRVALDLSEAVRDLRIAGIRSNYPGASDAELVRRFIFETHGFQPEAVP
jgi:hypothetical protein